MRNGMSSGCMQTSERKNPVLTSDQMIAQLRQGLCHVVFRYTTGEHKGKRRVMLASLHVAYFAAVKTRTPFIDATHGGGDAPILVVDTVLDELRRFVPSSVESFEQLTELEVVEA